MVPFATTGETQVPAPPMVPAPGDFPRVHGVEPPRLPAERGLGLAILAALAIGVAAGAKWWTGGALETAPVIFVAVAFASWWLDRRIGLTLAAGGGVAWAIVSLLRAPTVFSALGALFVIVALPAVAALVALARERERALRIEEARREQALGLLALQLRESVVSIDVAVPLLADPMKLDRAQGAAFDQVRRHARGLSRLANDLLTVDQIDTRKMQLTAVPLDLAAFVLEITEQRVPHDRVTIVTPAAPVQVNADPERLRQLLEHLLQNAMKFSPPGASIMVNVSSTGDEAKVDVRDHGVGLSPEDQSVLFTRYGRIRDARTANVPGIGLGLYLAKLVAEAHGGDLTASSPGRGLGSTFTLVLPLAGRRRQQRGTRQLPASSFWD